MTHEIKFEITSDGSPTIFRTDINEHYHSIYGARTESEHIFIKNGLKRIDKNEINILEVGMGSGLNLFLTILNSEQKIIHYDAIELYPISNDIAKQYSLQFEGREQCIINQINTSAWNENIIQNDKFTYRKIKADIHQIELNKKYDLIYFDAFSPDKQPDMWTIELFTKIYSAMGNDAILVTYCSKGIVKQALREVGFEVKRLEGPPHKHHMLIAIKQTVTN